MKIKTYISIAAAALLLASMTATGIIYKKYIDKDEQYVIAMSNYKASVSENSSYKLTIDQLKYEKDATYHKLDSVRKELGIKDKQLKQATYIKDSIIIKDTTILNDTIFLPNVNLDTTITNRWYKLSLSLRYPKTITTGIELENEKFIFTSTKRETVMPRKKFFIARWFQKRHTIVEISVKDSNPYIKQSDKKFIEIIK